MEGAGNPPALQISSFEYKNVKNQHFRREKEYLVLLSTDMSLAEEEVIRIYGKRWQIEVFFKVCKSHLRLTKECHSTSYDAMVAWNAIVMSRYMMLAVDKRLDVCELSREPARYERCESFSFFTSSFGLLVIVLSRFYSSFLCAKFESICYNTILFKEIR